MGCDLKLSVVILHQVSDKIPPFIARIDKNDRRRRHGAAFADWYFDFQRTICQESEGS